MTLYELGEDYLRQDEFLKAKISRLNGELKAKKGFDYINAKRDLLLCYKMSRELRETAAVLMHYYDKTPVKREYHPKKSKNF